MLRSRKERENQSGHYRDHGIVHKSRKEKAKSQLSNENKNYFYLAKPSSSQHTWQSFVFLDVYEHTVELRPRIHEDGKEGDHCWNFIFIFLGNDNNNIIKLVFLGKYAL